MKPNDASFLETNKLPWLFLWYYQSFIISLQLWLTKVIILTASFQNESREKDDRKYDAGGRLAEDREFFYHYDCEGNLVFKEFKEMALHGGIVAPINKGKLETELGITFHAFGTGWRYDWQSNGMLARIVRPDGKEVSFAYDKEGNKVWEQELDIYGRQRKRPSSFIPFKYQGQRGCRNGVILQSFQVLRPEWGKLYKSRPYRAFGRTKYLQLCSCPKQFDRSIGA